MIDIVERDRATLERLLEVITQIDDGSGDAAALRRMLAEIERLRAENERLRVENIQMKFALGYDMPADLEQYVIPANPFKCGVCDARATLSPQPENQADHD